MFSLKDTPHFIGSANVNISTFSGNSALISSDNFVLQSSDNFILSYAAA